MKFNPIELLTDLPTVFPMMWAVLRGKFKMPWSTLFWTVLCFIYVISPVDLLPDVLPLLGIADDGAFVLLVLSLLHNDVRRFRAERQKNEDVIEAEIVRDEEPKK